MFFARRESKWIWFTLINWLASGSVLLSITHLASYGSVQVLRELTTDDNHDIKWAFAVAVVSFTYLVGYFTVALAFVDVTSKSKTGAGMQRGGGFTAFVPPVYYFSVVVFSLRLSASLTYRMFIVLVSMAFLGVVNIAWKYSAAVSETKKKNEPHVHEDIKRSVPSSGMDRATAQHSNEASTCNFDVPKDSSVRNWYRQLAYDMAVYIGPALLFAVMVAPLRNLICVISLSIGIFPAVYNILVARIFLQPSPPEDPAMAAQRLTSYPNPGVHLDGWFRLADSCDIDKGQVKYLVTFNRHFAIFRGYDGYVRCVDAHCIHLGANMAIGGKVVDNCLECPFHRWRFDGTGQCTHIPYNDRIPDATKTKAYYVCEYYGMILVWIHGKDAAPSYYPPNIPKIDDGEFVYRGSRDTEVNMHIIEFAENSTDFMHFDPLHGRMAFPFTTSEIPGITVNHRPGWKQGEGDQSHITWFLDDADLNLFGKHYPETAASAVITFVGPAGVVFFSFETPIGSIVLFQTHTPVGELRLKVSFQWFATATMPRPLVWYIVGNWVGQWQNDISVWENKIFASKACLVKGDGPMQKQRRWLRQFYSGAIEKPLARPAGEGKEEADRAAASAAPSATGAPTPAVVTVDSPLRKHSSDSGDQPEASEFKHSNGNVDVEVSKSAKNVAKKTAAQGRKSTGVVEANAEMGATTRKRIPRKPVDMDF